MYDRATIQVEAGRGGDGCVSFRREAHVPKGGPDGGDGGHGGDVILICDGSLRDLAGMRRQAHVRAQRGSHGQGKDRHGARGADAVVRVPPGTQAEGIDGSRIDLVATGQRAVVACGGRGGHGNRRFATSTRQTPRFAERGTAGESGQVELRLKLLADAGLVGLPNAGKSSLITRLTRAAPKVADYPFTTVEPVLGTLEGDDRQIVLADIPGLIEGAAAGAGLGHEFLAHVERCTMLVHLVEVAPAEGDPEGNYDAVRAELGSYGAGLADLPELVVLSKSDLLTAEEAEGMRQRWADRLDDRALGVLAVSSATGAGLGDLNTSILAAVPEQPEPSREAAVEAPQFEAEHRVYRPAGEGGYRVEQEGEGAFRVQGRGVEMLFERHDLTNAEALAYLEQRLTEIGVLAALRDAGFEPGDELRIGEHEFELHPGDQARRPN
jgi:GTP-binding protein